MSPERPPNDTSGSTGGPYPGPGPGSPYPRLPGDAPGAGFGGPGPTGNTQPGPPPGFHPPPPGPGVPQGPGPGYFPQGAPRGPHQGPLPGSPPPGWRPGQSPVPTPQPRGNRRRHSAGDGERKPFFRRFGMFFAGFVAGLMTWAVGLGVSSYMVDRDMENAERTLYFHDGPSVGPGKHEVDVDAERSWYWSPGGDSCTWRVLDARGKVLSEKSDWVNELADLLDPKAAVFESLGCGDWRPVSFPNEVLMGPDAPRVKPIPAGSTPGISL